MFHQEILDTITNFNLEILISENQLKTDMKDYIDSYRYGIMITQTNQPENQTPISISFSIFWLDQMNIFISSCFNVKAEGIIPNAIINSLVPFTIDQGIKLGWVYPEEDGTYIIELGYMLPTSLVGLATFEQVFTNLLKIEKPFYQYMEEVLKDAKFLEAFETEPTEGPELN